MLAKAGVSGLGTSLATAIRTSFALAMAWAVAFGLGEVQGLSSVGTRGWALLALSGCATALSWLCYFRALREGPVSAVAPIDKLSIVFVLVFAAVFLGEPLTGRNLLGAGLILCGALVLVC